MNPIQAICVGVITIDTIALVDSYPSEDERVLAQEITRAGGGPAAVAAVALSRLGIQTAIIGTIGDDADGAEVMKIFTRENIDVSGVSIGMSATSGSVIVASRMHNTRAISTRQPMKQEPLNNTALNLLTHAEWIHADHVGIVALSEAGIVRGSGPLLSFDAGYGVEKFDSSTVDLFVPTDKQIALRNPGINLKDALEKEAKSGRNVVVATQGSDGSSGYSAETGFARDPGFSVDVVSTLGAGDVFHGALVAQFIQGYELQQAMRRANAVAALSCRGLDGQSKIPTTIELNEYLEALT